MDAVMERLHTKTSVIPTLDLGFLPTKKVIKPRVSTDFTAHTAHYNEVIPKQHTPGAKQRASEVSSELLSLTIEDKAKG